MKPDSPTPTPPSSRPRKRLVLLFDGTWNDPDNNTNVWRMKLMLADRAPDGVEQMTFYDTGVGTHWYDWLSGGAFGRGLSGNIRQGYQWLMEHHDEGDEVFVFGFSRGAFAARSLVGFIARCGLLLPTAPLPVIQAFERYRKGDAARPIYKLTYDERHGSHNFTYEERCLIECSRRIPIKFIGVWDTVGALGIPVGNIPGISRRTLFFHNTRLSNIIENAFHALAVDENRGPYRATLWTRFIPKGEPHAALTQAVEQRWFVGAHANVGGGYRNDPLAQIPLHWMQEKAKACGLVFRHEVALHGDECLADPVDSYAAFLAGFWRDFTFGRRFYRTIGGGRINKGEGWVESVNETVDETVLRRYREVRNYRPPNLQDWATRNKVDL